LDILEKIFSQLVPKRKRKENRTMSVNLTQLEQGFIQFFEDQRRSIPKAYGLGNEIRSLSKDGIRAVIDGKDTSEIKNKILDLWKQLGKLSLPKTFGAFQDFRTGQEMVELLAVDIMFPLVFDGSSTLGSVDWGSMCPEALDMEEMPQTWLFGMLDAGSELSRMVNRYIISHRKELPREKRMELRERFLRIGQELYDYLDRFTEITPAVMDAYNQFGFKQAFRSKMGQVRGAIESMEYLLTIAIEHGN
jgi:hypothetical protein